MKIHDSSDKNSVQNEAKGRRRFVRGVGVAIPIALTISARSAMACHCSTVSAHASIKLANSHNAKGDFDQTGLGCQGVSPTNWVSILGADTKNTILGKSDTFAKVFGKNGAGDNSIEWVLNSNNARVTDLMKHLAAAYLNIKNGRVNTKYYDENDLKAMWTGRSGSYQPVPNAYWGEGMIKEYLAKTWPL